MLRNPYFMSSYPSGTALHFAAHASLANNIQMLLKHDAEVNIKDENGQTALHIAAGRADSLSVGFLLAAGADVFIRDDEGKAAFHEAIKRTDGFKTIAQLLDAGYPIDTPTLPSQSTPGGATAFQMACGRNGLKIVQFLIEHGANVNHRDNRGRTALHWLSEQWLHEYDSCDRQLKFSVYQGFSMSLDEEVVAMAQCLLNIMERDAVFAIDTDGHIAYESVLATRKVKMAQDDGGCKAKTHG